MRHTILGIILRLTGQRLTAKTTPLASLSLSLSLALSLTLCLSLSLSLLLVDIRNKKQLSIQIRGWHVDEICSNMQISLSCHKR